jgi:hypothetical protein
LRIRSIKPEFYRSPDITDLAVEDRLLFVGLWSYVDDNGVGRDVESDIIGDLFSMDMFRDSRETVARVSRGLSNLSERGLIVRYTVDDRPFLFVSAWERHQRIDKPAKPRYPRPDAEKAILATLSRHPRDIPAPGTGEQRNRGTEEQDSLSPDESDDQGSLIPDNWNPNQRHIDKAKSLHLDPTDQAQRFRSHANRTQRRMKNWDTGFTNWLRKGAEFAQQRQGAPAYGTKQARADENAADYYRYYGGNDERAGSVPALDAGLG